MNRSDALQIAVIQSLFNKEVTDGLRLGAVDYLREHKIDPETQVTHFQAAGAYELPLLAKEIAKTKRFDGIICLGTVIKGDTAHFEFISLACCQGLMQVSLECEIPVALGVLTTYTEEQAWARSRMDSHNKGREAADACLTSILTVQRLRAGNNSHKTP